MTPSKTAAPSPIVLNELKPPGAARLVLFLHKKQFIGTVSLWHLKTENLLLFAEVKTGRCHFKNKMLGNEGPQKRLVALAEFMEACLFWQMFLKSRFIFVVYTVWICLWGVRPCLLTFGLLLGSCQSFVCPPLLCPSVHFLSPGYGQISLYGYFIPTSWCDRRKQA